MAKTNICKWLPSGRWLPVLTVPAGEWTDEAMGSKAHILL